MFWLNICNICVVSRILQGLLKICTCQFSVVIIYTFVHLYQLSYVNYLLWRVIFIKMHHTRLALDTLTVACSVKRLWLGVCWLLFSVYYHILFVCLFVLRESLLLLYVFYGLHCLFGLWPQSTFWRFMHTVKWVIITKNDLDLGYKEIR